jgi:hypothetical protein
VRTTRVFRASLLPIVLAAGIVSIGLGLLGPILSFLFERTLR